jgi:hypothetical protein
MSKRRTSPANDPGVWEVELDATSPPGAVLGALAQLLLCLAEQTKPSPPDGSREGHAA